MAIPPEDVAQVRGATDMAALVGEHSSLKRVGRRFVGLCPFHQEKSPSFSVDASQGLYYCFGCGASGDAISFVQAMDGIDFVEAVERLAARAGIAIRHDGASSAAAQADHKRRQAMLDATAAAVAYYHDRLLRHPDAGAARQYLRSRGYDGETVRRFVLGWAPAGGQDLIRALDKPVGLLKALGLAHDGPSGRPQDTFRSRVIFPIFDTSTRPIALGGRILPGADTSAGPKYRNSAESPIYSKRRTLYGLNWAKVALQHQPEVVVCEGYTDVIGFFTADVPRAVATCGTALTDDHLKVLGSFAKRVVLAFDADAAGQSAAARIYESEHRHGLEVAVAALPPGSDPADLAKSDPEALRRSVEAAIPFLAFRIDRAMAAADLRTPEGRVRAAEAALPVVAEHPNNLVRDQYLLMVADRCQIDPDQLRARLARVLAEPTTGASHQRRQDREPPPGDEPPPPDDTSYYDPQGPSRPPQKARRRPDGWDPESLALMLAIQRPREMAPYVHEALFADETNRLAIRALANAASLHSAIDEADPEIADLLRRLAVDEAQDDVDGAVLTLVRIAADRTVADLDRASREAGRAGDSPRVAEISTDLTWVMAELGRIAALEDTARADEGNALLAWLVRHSEEVP
jgi:DNA primase